MAFSIENSISDMASSLTIQQWLKCALAIPGFSNRLPTLVIYESVGEPAEVLVVRCLYADSTITVLLIVYIDLGGILILLLCMISLL